MALFLTGATGYIGAHVLANLLEQDDEPIALLVRGGQVERLWKSMQLHMNGPTLRGHLRQRLRIVDGDLTRPRFGLDEAAFESLAGETDSIIHCAATLNRKSEKACLNVNLRGLLEMIRLARRARESGGLRRFSHVSTVAVAGERQDELVLEDEAIDWDRSDYDPYARTKKFGELLLAELLPDVSRTIFRPSVVLGDSRRGETTQFEMVRAFVFLARLPLIPLRGGDRIDIVPVDYVADAVSTIHRSETPAHGIYHLSAGSASLPYREITLALAHARGKRASRFAPFLAGPFRGCVDLLASAFRGSGVGRAASRMQVFWPYLRFNTVFDNARVREALGRAPAPFSDYCFPLLRYAIDQDFQYPYREWTP